MHLPVSHLPTLLPAAVAALCALCAYSASWWLGFAWDDEYLIVNNPSVHGFGQALDWFALPWASGSGDAQGRAQNALYWRPLTQASFALDWWVGGSRPWAFHVTNTVLHAAASAGVALTTAAVAGRLQFSRASKIPPGLLAGIVAGVFFALHPVHGEAVNLATYRSTLLVGAASFAALALSTRNAPRAVWAECALYAAALMAKEDGAVLPGLIVLARYAAFGEFPGFRRYLPHAAMLAGWWIARSVVTGPALLDFFAGATLADKIFTLLKVYALNLRLMVWPWPLTPFYDWTILPIATDWARPEVLGGALLLAGTLAALVWSLSQSQRFVTWLTGHWLIALLPYAHFLPFFDAAGERFLYVPSLAACATAGLMVAWAHGHGRALARFSWIGASAVSVAFSALTVGRIAHFDSTETLLVHTASQFPHSFNAHYELARIYAEQKRLPEALERAHLAHQNAPRLEAGAIAVVEIMLMQGRQQDATEFLRAQVQSLGVANAPALADRLRQLQGEY